MWVTTGLLWSVWLMQDAANIAVYLPRSLGVWELVGFCAVIFVGLGFLFRFGGARVQQIVDEKSHVVDLRMATVINLVFALILYIFKIESEIPMSTTWVFVGLLAGREIGMAIRGTNDGNMRRAFKLMGKDLLYVFIGLAISLGLALAVNGAACRSERNVCAPLIYRKGSRAGRHRVGDLRCPSANTPVAPPRVPRSNGAATRSPPLMLARSR